MINKLKIKIIREIEKYGFERKVMVNSKILEKEFLVRKGTIRTKADKDDAWLFQLSKSAKTIFDIGSNIGQSAILMSYNNPKKIVLVDPNPKALSIASENMILNNLGEKSIFYNCFVGEKSGELIDFYTIGSGAAGSKYKSFARTASYFQSCFKVKTKTLDEISKETNMIPELIKLDVEGAELEALKGGVEIAKKQQTIFFVEIHSGTELSIIDNTKYILLWCEDNDYKAIYLKKMTDLKINDIENRGRYHALLIPKNNKIPKEITKIKEGDSLNNFL